MIDIAEFRNRADSMELHLFQNLCMRHVDAAKEKLLKKYVISSIFDWTKKQIFVLVHRKSTCFTKTPQLELCIDFGNSKPCVSKDVAYSRLHISLV